MISRVFWTLSLTLSPSLSWSVQLTFLVHLGHFCSQKAALWCGDTFLSPKNLSYDHLMKLKWLIANITAVGSPLQQREQFFWLIWCFLIDLGHFCSQGVTLRTRDTFLSPKSLNEDHLNYFLDKPEGLRQIRDYVRKALCKEIPDLLCIFLCGPLLAQHRVVDCQCNSCWVTCRSRKFSFLFFFVFFGKCEPRAVFFSSCFLASVSHLCEWWVTLWTEDALLGPKTSARIMQWQ